MRSSVRRETRHLVTAHPPHRTGCSTPTLVRPRDTCATETSSPELVSVIHLVPAPSVREKGGTSFIRPNIPQVDQYTAASGINNLQIRSILVSREFIAGNKLRTPRPLAAKRQVKVDNRTLSPSLGSKHWFLRP